MDTFKLVNFFTTQESIISQDTDLSICITTDGFFFSLVDKNNYNLKLIGEFKTDITRSITDIMNNIRQSLASVNIRLYNFNTIRIIIQTNKNIFVPYKLYDNSKTKEYLRSVSLLNPSEIVLESISERLDNVSVFACNMHQNSGIKILMPKAKFISQHQVMAEYAYEVSKIAKNTAILYKREKAFDLVVFKGTKFVCGNSFDASNENDMIYHILFTFEQLGIDNAEISFLITGEDYTMEEKQVLRKFIKEVAFANPMESIKIGEEFSGLNIQKYFLALVK